MCASPMRPSRARAARFTLRAGSPWGLMGSHRFQSTYGFGRRNLSDPKAKMSFAVTETPITSMGVAPGGGQADVLWHQGPHAAPHWPCLHIWLRVSVASISGIREL